ncbi:MAG: hypothetical protein Q4D26_03205 [Clostridia bacterium]|nr:hypothetical protein [Clostridia bacterium]
MRKEYNKPNMIVTSFETIDITSIGLAKSAMITPKNYTSGTFTLHE